MTDETQAALTLVVDQVQQFVKHERSALENTIAALQARIAKLELAKMISPKAENVIVPLEKRIAQLEAAMPALLIERLSDLELTAADRTPVDPLPNWAGRKPLPPIKAKR